MLPKCEKFFLLKWSKKVRKLIWWWSGRWH